MVEQQSDNKEMLRRLHTKAEERLSNAKDLSSLAESVARRFDSQDWARTIYKKAVEASDLQKVKFDVAASVEKVLGDRSLAGTIRNS
jgi:hypothetical protein